jgi:hypothetical protein
MNAAAPMRGLGAVKQRDHQYLSCSQSIQVENLPANQAVMMIASRSQPASVLMQCNAMN